MKAALALVLGVLVLGTVVVGPGLVLAHDSEGSEGEQDGGSQSSGAESGDTLTHLSLEGFVDVPPVAPGGPGGSLSLPLGPADPAAVVLLTFGVPAVQVPITITPDTRVKDEAGSLPPIVVVDGDRLKVDVQVIGNVLWARRIRLEEFPELRLEGVAHGIPAGGVPLPLAPGTFVDITVALGGSSLTLPVRLTPKTKLSPGTFTLHDGDPVEVKAIVNDFHIVAVKLERED